MQRPTLFDREDGDRLAVLHHSHKLPVTTACPTPPVVQHRRFLPEGTRLHCTHQTQGSGVVGRNQGIECAAVCMRAKWLREPGAGCCELGGVSLRLRMKEPAERFPIC